MLRGIHMLLALRLGSQLFWSGKKVKEMIALHINRFRSPVQLCAVHKDRRGELNAW